MRNLNQKEQAMLECIRALCKKNGYSPSVRDLCESMGYKSTSTVQLYLDRLAEYGYIRRADGKSRSILLCETESYRTIRCLRKGIVPSENPGESDFEGELPFAYAGELPTEAQLIAVWVSDAWWIIALGDQLFDDKPTVCVQNGMLVLANDAAEKNGIGVLVAKIRLY